MSLSSSLFTGTSGLTNMGNAMQVVGNNISNVNTVGFKKGRSTFADTLSQSVATQSGTAQVGRGMSMGAVDQSFETGSFESTGNSTDLSIGGDGFFVVREAKSERNFYTRAGNFHFDKVGQLVNPEGYLVQGWKLDEATGDDMGAIRDIVLDAFTSPPKKSSRVSMITNLDSDANSQSVVLSNGWNAEGKSVMAPTNYEYQSVVKVYDALGSTHDVTVYYDKKRGTEWEYVVACNPNEDNRNLVQGTASKGLLARGTIKFSESSGDVLKFTMEEFTGRIGNVKANGVNNESAIKFEIDDTEIMSLDGYGFDLEFDGNSWMFAPPVAPAVNPPGSYLNAQILYNDNQTVHIVLDSTIDLEPDIRIRLDQPAVATDSFKFDINDPKGLHVQSIEGTTYFGDTANDNTTLEINSPEVMTHDVPDIKIVWNPSTETWSWDAAIPPADYSNATLKGDKDRVVIDLDGSGNDFDKEDIVFRFAKSLKFGPSADPVADRSEITFDILGSTAWRQQSVDEIKDMGYFSFNTDFLGGEFGSTESRIELDIGTRYDGINFINDSLSSTQYARSSNTTFQDADGYSAGDLQGVNVASDGIMTGIYSNGQLIPLFRVGLAKFLNNNGLSNAGGNLFAATRDSGAAITNKPGENGLGTIAPNSLEMSNVDLSEEFVKMITTQRGFQANSKTITTVDGMMETVIQMKR